MSSSAMPARPLSIDLVANLSRGARQEIAWRDLRDGVAAYRLAVTLGWLDIKLRYRGSVLGPFWLTLSTAVMVLAMGVLYSQLFRMELHDYMPYLALSLVLWNTLGGIVSDACVCFTSVEGTIRSIRMPFTIYAVRVLVRNGFVLLHNVAVIVGVFAYYGTWPGAAALLAVPALLVWVVDSIAACLLLGSFCARFRDIPPIVGSIMQIAFFLTPIIWRPELIGPKARFLLLNPFYPVLALVREPLLNQVPPASIWLSAAAWSGVWCVAAWLLFARVRGRLAFWV